VDYVLTWGPASSAMRIRKSFLPSKPPPIMARVSGIPNPFEVTMAELICELVPSVQKVRMCNSGTEACMSAIRLARASRSATKSSSSTDAITAMRIHCSSRPVRRADICNPDSAGVPAAFTQHTIVLPFTTLPRSRPRSPRTKIKSPGIIVEPVPGNAGLYLPRPGYLEFLSEVTRANGALLIFDEVMTGFRLAPGRAQERFGIKPDLTTLGKIIGGGCPSARSVGGRTSWICSRRWAGLPGRHVERPIRWRWRGIAAFGSVIGRARCPYRAAAAGDSDESRAGSPPTNALNNLEPNSRPG